MMRIALGKFGRAGIEAQLGPDVPAGISRALTHYSRRLKSEQAPASLPRFRCEPPEDLSWFDVELPGDPEVERTLWREQRRQGASLEQLMTHAVFVFLSDLDRAKRDGAPIGDFSPTLS